MSSAAQLDCPAGQKPRRLTMSVFVACSNGGLWSVALHSYPSNAPASYMPGDARILRGAAAVENEMNCLHANEPD